MAVSPDCPASNVFRGPSRRPWPFVGIRHKDIEVDQSFATTKYAFWGLDFKLIIKKQKIQKESPTLLPYLPESRTTCIKVGSSTSASWDELCGRQGCTLEILFAGRHSVPPFLGGPAGTGLPRLLSLSFPCDLFSLLNPGPWPPSALSGWHPGITAVLILDEDHGVGRGGRSWRHRTGARGHTPPPWCPGWSLRRSFPARSSGLRG